MIENITTATPAEIDTEIARLYGEYTEPGVRIPGMVALNAEYTRRGGWTRVYRVDNSNGHVHTSTACSTTYGTTSFGWIPELSGSTPEEIVGLAGEYACLVCFGAVRADILKAREGRPCRIETGRQRRTREEREEREAAQAVKAAAKDAKKLIRSVTTHDGSSRIATKAAAWTTLVEAVIEVEDWNDPTMYAHLSVERRAANARDYAADVETLRAVLVESLPELSAEEFETALTKKVRAKKAAHNRALRAAGYPARY